MSTPPHACLAFRFEQLRRPARGPDLNPHARLSPTRQAEGDYKECPLTNPAICSHPSKPSKSSDNDLDLFADELDEHYSHAGAYSTLGCLSSMDCICTLSTICTIFEDGETLPEVGG